MMETRLAREMEKSRSVLAKARGPIMTTDAHRVATNGLAKLPVSVVAIEEEEKRKAVVDKLTDDQMHMFEKGNQDMLQHLESTLDKVRQVYPRPGPL